MLKELYIKNIALIDEAQIEFDKGLNVLSGETGSGKSVILESINFVLGSKADRTMIRYGENEALVRAVFIVDGDCDALKKLNGYDIESDGTIIVSRKLTAEGKSSSKINGQPVTASMLKNVTQSLVDVHGQSEHFYLLSEDNQLKVIDSLNADTEQIKSELNKLLSEKRENKMILNSLGGNKVEIARKLDMLNYQIDEIRAADLKVGEDDELKEKRTLYLNAEKIISSLNSARSYLENDEGCLDGLSAALHQINQITGYSERYDELSSRFQGVYEELSDISSSLSDLCDNFTFDEREARQIDERLDLINSLKKKYGENIEEVLKFLAKSENEYNYLINSENIIDKATKDIKRCNDEIFILCQKLTRMRKMSSEVLCKSVISELKSLNIQNASFSVYFNDYDYESANLDSPVGADEIRFEFSANKGEPLKPLNKVISGGEMSRFMLAIKSHLKEINGISSYIFDEIDSGISGFTAITVARKFIEISKNTQIIAVSHLPQVCAASDSQFLIYKREVGGKTITNVKRLSEDEKILEIVRLTGSVSSDAATLHAKELIEAVKNTN